MVDAKHQRITQRHHQRVIEPALQGKQIQNRKQQQKGNTDQHDENDAILYDSYTSNKGNPLDVVLEDLKKIYETNPNIKIYGAYATRFSLGAKRR